MNAEKMAMRLVELRGKKTQQAVADALKISRSALGMYELGIRVPRDTIKMRMAAYYGVTVQELFYSETEGG